MSYSGTIARTAIFALCAGLLAGCGGFGIGLGLGMAEQSRRWMEEACADLARRGIVVQEFRGLRIPIDEENITGFAPTEWHVEGLLAGTFRQSRPAAAVSGTLMVTRTSVMFLPSGEDDGVRIPLATVLGTPYRYNLMGEPRALTVRSCGGRIDVFVIGRRDEPARPDSEAIARAASQLDANYAATPDRASLLPWQRAHPDKPKKPED